MGGKVGTSKGAGYGSFNQNPPYEIFQVAADLTSAPPHRAAPLAAVVFLDVDVEFHTHGWVCSSSRALVDIERAPFLGVASRLSASNSNTRIPPLIRPHPFRQEMFHTHHPRLLIGRVSVSIQSQKTISD
jgi:hypothetical protein